MVGPCSRRRGRPPLALAPLLAAAAQLLGAGEAAGNADAPAVYLVSSKELTSCLGVRSPAGGAQAGLPLELLDCDREGPGIASIRWRLPPKGHWVMTSVTVSRNQGKEECVADASLVSPMSGGQPIGLTCCTPRGVVAWTNCQAQEDYNSAKLHCEALGLALCARDEIEADAGDLAHCDGGKPRPVWTRDDCRVKGVLQLAGSDGAGGALCLAAPAIQEKAGSKGPALQLVPCGAPNTTSWIWDSQTRFVEASGSGFCLDRTGTAPVMRNCTQVGAANWQQPRGQQWLAMPTGTAESLAQFRFPLHVQGRFVVDAVGTRVKLAGINWAGAHMEQRVNNGLIQSKLTSIARLIRRFGFTHVRMNYAVEMMWDEKPVPLELVRANPELAGRTPLAVFDACVKALTDEGLLVVVNSHTSDYRWCCSLQDEQALWYNDRWPEAKWLASLTMLAERYRSNPRVIGFDIRNEPRPSWVQGKDPTLLWWDPVAAWDKCTSMAAYVGADLSLDLGSFSSRGVCLQEHTESLRLAAEQGSLAVWNGNPDALVFIEGPAGADLIKVLQEPLRFVQGCLTSRVVWSIHDYGWAWRWFELADVLNNRNTNFYDIYARLKSIYTNANSTKWDGPWGDAMALRQKAWAYLIEEGLAPVWVGEFGTESGDKKWWKNYLRYAEYQDVDWAIWVLDGYKYPPNVTLYDGGNYMDSAQKLDERDVVNGTTQAFIREGYGFLDGADYNSVQYPAKVQSLLDLAPARLGPGVAAGEKKLGPMERCIFDKTLQPVTGTGPRPRGFDAYKQVQRLTCPAPGPQGRRLDPPQDEPPPPVPVLVDDGDWRMVGRLRALQAEACSAGDEAGAKLREDRARRYASLAAAADSPNPVEAALKGVGPRDPAAIIAVKAADLARIWEVFLLGAVIFVCTVGLAAVHSAPPEACDRALSHVSVALASLRPPPLSAPSAEPAGADPAPKGDKPVPAGAAVLKTDLERLWHPVAGCAFLVAFVMGCIFIAQGIRGRVRLAEGASAAACSAAGLAGDGLAGTDVGSDGGFLGFLPALGTVSELVDVLSPNGTLHGNITFVLGHIGKVQAAYDAVGAELGSLKAAVSQSGAECAFQPDTRRLLAAAQGRIAQGERELREAADDLENAFGDSRADRLRGDLADALSPLRDVKNIVLNVVQAVYLSEQGEHWTQVANSIVQLLAAIFVLILPPAVCACFAGVRLLRNKFGASARPGWRMSWVRSYEQAPPNVERFTWTCSLAYAHIAFVIALLTAIVVQKSANACVVLNELATTGIGPYANGVNLPTDELYRSMSVLVFQNCMCDGGSGKILDVVEFDGCVDGKLVERPGTLRNRLNDVERSLTTWFEDNAGTGDELLVTPEVQELLAHLDGLASPDFNTTCRSRTKGGFWCPPDPPAVTPGQCNLQQLILRASRFSTAIFRAVAEVDAEQRVLESSAFMNASDYTRKVVFANIRQLLRMLDCGFLGARARGLADAVCVGAVSGIQDISQAHGGLALVALLLALVEYVVWRQLLHYHRQQEHLLEATALAAERLDPSFCGKEPEPPFPSDCALQPADLAPHPPGAPPVPAGGPQDPRGGPADAADVQAPGASAAQRARARTARSRCQWVARWLGT